MHKFLAAAGLNGAMGVAFGAWAAHGLEGRLSPAALDWIRTGASYQLWHAVALLGLAALATRHATRLIAVAGTGFGVGALLFGGSLYLYAWTGQGWFATITPVGGAMMIGGWLATLAAAFRVGARS
ncbi:DUF423 domain-containing protein [Dongia deserti]|uniref:DUF423 domain-containing protein n=1 Tax=Dongia deserti TaxID=2268030 RepID=UPI002547CC27|nr:DUF423 domain-containing protein [Dongia deserti]